MTSLGRCVKRRAQVLRMTGAGEWATYPRETSLGSTNGYEDEGGWMPERPSLSRQIATELRESILAGDLAQAP